MTRFLFLSVISLWTALSAAAVTPAVAEGPELQTQTAGSAALVPPDANVVIAKVGDQAITFGQINTMMNSSAVVGVSVPALGTPQRQGVAVVLLDKIISANLLYLDALKQGADKDQAYQAEVQAFADGVIAGLYRKQALLADIEVTDEEVDAYDKKAGGSSTRLTDEESFVIKAALRKKKLDAQESRLREKVRQGVEIAIDRAELDPADDEVRDDATVVAKVSGQELTWGDVKQVLLGESKRASMSGGRLDPVDARVTVLDDIIDTRIMAEKGRAAGLDQDAAYQARVGEYRKTHLINLYRNRLLKQMEPSEEEIAAYYRKNKDQIAMREERKIQMLVLKTEEEARDVKKKIESGELTIYEAARDYSIDPKAKQTLGEMGWVAKGTGFPALDELTFSLKPDELGGPVKSPAGWHLVKVEDQRSAQNLSLADANARKMTRRDIMRDRLNKYVVDLRLHAFPVEVYQDRLNDEFSKEAAWIAQLEQKAKAPNSLTQQRTEEMQKLLKP
jgi:parvulin-like peptidyl-prolyl isomerase